jgi:hypothetical protein
MAAVKLERNKPHQTYHLKDGTKVIGASTVASVDKPSAPLMWWAHKLARMGKCWKDELKSSGDIGTISHFMVECHLRGDEWDLSEFTEAEIQLAMPPYEKFIEFWEEKQIEPVAIEAQLVSEAYGYGGTIDLVGKNPEGRVYIFDWKTSKSIYESHLFQVAGYFHLWNENNPELEANRACIVRIGKDPKDKFEQHWISDHKMPLYWDVFQANLSVLKAKKKIYL